jgi:large subunit ribosomal protein L1
MSQKGKRYQAAVSNYDRAKLYSPQEALGLVKQMAQAKFDETVELSFRLGLDVRKADQQVRGTVTLPKGTGRTVRVVVFAQADRAREAREAGADVVGDKDLAERIEKGWTDFDVAIATPDMMPVVGKLGKILGPRGLMPNPKSGTVTTDVAKTVSDFKGGKIAYKTDRQANVHTVIGKASFPLEDLAANYLTVVDEVMRAKPSVAKGRYVHSMAVSSTMGPGVRIDPIQAKRVEDAMAAAD